MFFIGVGSKCSQNLWLNIQTKVCIFRLVNHVALNINSKLGELYAKRILEKLEKKETSENNFENKNGSLDNMDSHFCENDKILKEKEAELDNFVHQPPLGGGLGIRTPGCFHIGGFQDHCFRPLSQTSMFFMLILFKYIIKKIF